MAGQSPVATSWQRTVRHTPGTTSTGRHTNLRYRRSEAHCVTGPHEASPAFAGSIPTGGTIVWVWDSQSNFFPSVRPGQGLFGVEREGDVLGDPAFGPAPDLLAVVVGITMGLPRRVAGCGSDGARR